jgi:hypothetical protein
LGTGKVASLKRSRDEAMHDCPLLKVNCDQIIAMKFTTPKQVADWVEGRLVMEMKKNGLTERITSGVFLDEYSKLCAPFPRDYAKQAEVYERLKNVLSQEGRFKLVVFADTYVLAPYLQTAPIFGESVFEGSRFKISDHLESYRDSFVSALESVSPVQGNVLKSIMGDLQDYTLTEIMVSIKQAVNPLDVDPDDPTSSLLWEMEKALAAQRANTAMKYFQGPRVV